MFGLGFLKKKKKNPPFLIQFASGTFMTRVCVTCE